MFTPIVSIPTQRPVTPLLDKVEGVDDLRRLTEHQLPLLAYEMRHYLLYCVGQTGGHLGAGLGVVELTIALHYLLNTPKDRLIWDVGHQAYPHKLLTGRKQQMLSMRKKGGLSPFPKRTESPFDCFGVGHSSTSISALLGMALIDQDVTQHVAVIGDGALTSGMAYEALNHMAHAQASTLVILNDNDMSISANHGGLANFLGNDTTHGGPKAWFTDLGFTYVGPIDGHNFNALITHLQALLALPGPKLLHVHTVKGKGYRAAEQDPTTYHAIDKIDPIQTQKTAKHDTFAQIFGRWACQQAAVDGRLQMITPAMVKGSGLNEFAKLHTARLHDVAIAEQHAVTLAAGMACVGGKPVVAIYSTFLQRGYDQLIHDVALQNLDVLFAIDRAGIVGEDGATHTGAYDYSYLACLPNMLVMAPSNAEEALALLDLGYHHPGPVAVRYPRASAQGSSTQPNPAPETITIGTARQVLIGKDIAILDFGALLDTAQVAAQSLNATLIDMRFIKPLDKNMLQQLLDHKLWVTVEDHVIVGGAGALVSQWLAAQTQANKPRLITLGLNDTVQTHGTRAEILAANGLDSDGILKAIEVAITQETPAKY